MSESLTVFWGALFNNACIPLEISMNWCSMGCSYCFSNLNSPNRTANIPQIMGLLSGFQEKSTYAAQLLKAGYPVTISNHIDPFADSNAKQALTILEVMTELGIRYSLQTKCGKPGYDALKFISPTVFYISIMSMDEDVLRRVEPGAPSAKERLRFIEAARALSHRVCVGINPIVPEWIQDPLPLCKELKHIGVESIWVQLLHLSCHQVQNMSDREKAALGETVIARGRKFRRDSEMRTAYLKTREAAEECGMAVYDAQQRERSDYFKPYKETYPRLFPLGQDFVNYCYDTGKGANDPIYFEEWRDFMLPYFPQGVFPLRNHLGAVQYAQFWRNDRNNEISRYMTYETLLDVIWRNSDITFHPCHIGCFGLAGELDQSDGLYELYLDENDRPILLFRPEGVPKRATQWEAW